MKQVVLDPRSGRISVAETPAPQAASGRLLVATDVSIISPGTERLLIELSSKSAFGKARARPEAVRQVVDTLRKEGVRSALWKAGARLDHPYPLGYSLAGVVVRVGDDLAGPSPGTRVACAGSEIASHAELVSVPPLLAVPVPDEVSQEDGAFASIGAIAMHAVRLSKAEPGGRAAVLGLGLVGQLIVQILGAAGVRAYGVDPNAERRRLASDLARCETYASAEEVAARDPGGVDAVLVAAAASDPQIISDAISIMRDRGRLTVVGSVPIVADRDAMYRKELTLIVARSLGPGRYEPSYEEHGVDMPIGQVRWTEGRNMDAFLELVRQGKLTPSGLITHRFRIEDAGKAYDLLDQGDTTALALALTYTRDKSQPQTQQIALPEARKRISGRPGVAVIGAGTFARGVLLPRLQKEPIDLIVVATASGASASGTARRFRFRRAGTDVEAALTAEDVSAAVVATRHDLHAGLATRALELGRSVYVEKPLALRPEDLLATCRAWASSDATLSVGFNRRFAPLIVRLRQALTTQAPLAISYLVNAERPTRDSWILDPIQGGGVALSEGGHFLDTLAFLVGEPASAIDGTWTDDCSYQARITFAGGSVASLAYSTGSHGRGPKELVTIVGRGVVAEFTDFRSVRIWRDGQRSNWRSRRQDKGHTASLAAWVQGLKSGQPAVPMTEVIASSVATLALHDALQSGERVTVDLTPYAEALGSFRR